MALKWTKTSGPDSCVMNPNPLSPLNHLTVPVVMDNPLHPWPDSDRGPCGRAACCRRGNCLATPRYDNLPSRTSVAPRGSRRAPAATGWGCTLRAGGAVGSEEYHDPQISDEDGRPQRLER